LEVNITILIQLGIFLASFLILSNLLFKPLNNLHLKKEKYLLLQNQEIAQLNTDIQKHKQYIGKNTTAITNKTVSLYNKIINNSATKKEYKINYLNRQFKENYLKFKNYLNHEEPILIDALNKSADKVSVTIQNKFYNINN
jgi:F0F1-type ATP synthase membrane subunit b/b'